MKKVKPIFLHIIGAFATIFSVVIAIGIVIWKTSYEKADRISSWLMRHE